MKRWLIILAAFAAALALSPSSGTDAAKLQPIQTIYIYKEDEVVTILTDTGDQGKGKSIDEAFNDMKQTVAGEVFMETAEFLIVTEETRQCIDKLYDELRPACRICLAEGDLELESTTKYLSAHEPKSILKDYRAGNQKVSELQISEGRMYLAE